MGMKAIITTIFLFLTAITPLAAEELNLILNMANQSRLPKNFRIDLSLNASASGQFSAKSLETMLSVLPPNKKILIVDLRQESHGFADGSAVSWRLGVENWANLHKTQPQIIEDETERLKKLATQKVAMVLSSDVLFPLLVQNTVTEEELINSHYLHYLRIPIPDHRKPTRTQVDQFVLTVRELPADAWIHFHCSAGKGRSTTFFAMYDMLKNAKKDSLTTILERQYQLGGVNFLAPTTKVWKQAEYLKKQRFLREFYYYCNESDPSKVLWSEWLSKHRNDS